MSSPMIGIPWRGKGWAPSSRSAERRVGAEGRYWRDWSSDVCSSDLGLEPLALQHVLEVHVAAEVQLVGVVDRQPAVLEELRQHTVRDRRAELALDVVADDRDPVAGEALRPVLEIGRASGWGRGEILA